MAPASCRLVREPVPELAGGASCPLPHSSATSPVRDANRHLHPFRRRANSREVIPRFPHDLVDHHILVIRIVMKQNQFLRAALHHDVDSLAPMTVSPPAPLGLVLLRKI